MENKKTTKIHENSLLRGNFGAFVFSGRKNNWFLPDTLCPSTAEQKQKASDAMDQQHVTCLTSPVPDSQQLWSHFIF